MEKEAIIKLMCGLLSEDEDKGCECKITDLGSEIKIAVLGRGWVCIGRYHEEGDKGVLENAYVIRRWGTSEGLGQLANEGKQGDTVLEKTGVVRFERLTSIMLIDVDQKKWKNEF